MKSPYKIGAGKAVVRITPDMFPFGFGRGMQFFGLHDDLYVRALILENAETRLLYLTLDLDSFGHIEEWKDKPIAFFVNYAVHGSVMAEMMEGPDYKLEVTGDLPGYSSRFIEERYDNRVVALWTSGAAGNQDAKYRATRYAYDAKGELYRYNVGNQGYALCDMQARDLAGEVLRVSEEVMGPA